MFYNLRIGGRWYKYFYVRNMPFNTVILSLYAWPGNPYQRGRVNTVNLLVPTSSYHILFIMKILFIITTKQVILRRRSIVLSLPLHQWSLGGLWLRPSMLGLVWFKAKKVFLPSCTLSSGPRNLYCVSPCFYWLGCHPIHLYWELETIVESRED